MILESTIENVVNIQKNKLLTKSSRLLRRIKVSYKSLNSHALIISGVRRCGKSTLLLQIIAELDPSEEILFLNFENPQLFDFKVQDFYKLDAIIERRKAKILFFDELQIVEGWESYVRQKLDEGYKVIITGSNASLLSQELGTKLTGRQITQELFPFSFTEYLEFLALKNTSESITSYMNEGGFPEYLKTMDTEQLYALFNDILYRDIVTRNGIKDSKSIYRLALYLFSNIGNRITATKLKQPLSIGATSTVMSWFSFLEISYLVSFVPMYSTSTKAQLVNPRKVYAIDLGMVKSVSTNLTEDLGRKLENMVFLFLRAKYKEIYYFDMQGECDFVCFKNNKIVECIQVCYDLTPDNLTRELAGLSKALSNFGLTKGTIVTFNQSDYFEKDGMQITVIPANQFLTN
jgi:predicted AAA+ superfamily ATPase